MSLCALVNLQIITFRITWSTTHRFFPLMTKTIIVLLEACRKALPSVIFQNIKLAKSSVDLIL